jgi:hypothetical protein
MPPLWSLFAAGVIAFSLERQVLWTLFKTTTGFPIQGNTPLAYLLTISLAILAHNLFIKFVPHKSLWPHHFVGVFSAYGLYSYMRNSLGSTAGVEEAAINNAHRIVSVERALHLGFEPALQRFWLSLPFRGFTTLFGGYYSIAHALCTALVLVFLFRKNRSRYAYALKTIAVSCIVALLFFRFFPTMPPRLFSLHDSSFAMKDTLSSSSTSETNQELLRVSNQYAAVPSMHCAWAFFTFLMLYPYRRLRLLALAHFAMTVLIVLTTAHHFWLDVLLGMFAVSVLPLWKRTRSNA